MCVEKVERSVSCYHNRLFVVDAFSLAFGLRLRLEREKREKQKKRRFDVSMCQRLSADGLTMSPDWELGCWGEMR
jgi:hypothetical protein